MSNFRATGDLSAYLAASNVVGIADIDTRKLTRILREKGAQAGCIAAGEAATRPDLAIEAARRFPGLKGMDLAKVVTVKDSYRWTRGSWELASNRETEPGGEQRHVVVYDFGVKRNILRMLVDRGCRVTVVPAQTPAASFSS